LKRKSNKLFSASLHSPKTLLIFNACLCSGGRRVTNWENIFWTFSSASEFKYFKVKKLKKQVAHKIKLDILSILDWATEVCDT
jgi:hypothetical protein